MVNKIKVTGLYISTEKVMEGVLMHVKVRTSDPTEKICEWSFITYILDPIDSPSILLLEIADAGSLKQLRVSTV
jgi:hypothetical protein